MTTTAWFAASERPVRVGVYEVKVKHLSGVWYSYWDGSSWGHLAAAPATAEFLASVKTIATVIRWRGVVEPEIVRERVVTHVTDTDCSYRYPAAGDPRPPAGAKCLLLTRGGVCVTGIWSDTRDFLAWAPMPRRNREKESMCSATS